MRVRVTMLIVLLGGLSVGEARVRASGADDPTGRSTIAPIPSEPRPKGDGGDEPAPPEPAVKRGPGHRTEEVRFRCGGNTLAGVLVLPEKPAPCPAIAFVFGSGPADRTYYGTAPHLWKHFAGRGF